MKPIIIILFSFLFGYLFCWMFAPEDIINFSTSRAINPPTNNSTITIISDCSNLSLFRTANCLNKWVKLNYNYNLTNSDKFSDNHPFNEMSTDELFTLGGCCRDYSNFYKRMFEIFGYTAEEKVIRTSDGAHIFTIAYNEERDYCIADQKEQMCVKVFEGDDEE